MHPILYHALNRHSPSQPSSHASPYATCTPPHRVYRLFSSRHCSRSPASQATAAAPPPASPRPTMTTAKPLIVVLGLGEMGVVHATNLSKERRILLGLASTRPHALTATSARLAADRLYSSYDQVFSDPDVRAIVIATPPASHPPLIARAAAANLHIFCEKPLASDSASIRQALSAVRQARVRFMVGFQRRWDPAFSDAKRRLDCGEMGRPLVVKCTSGDPEYPEKYQRHAEKDSILLDLAVHDIDLARWLTGSEVARVFAIADALTYPTLQQMGDNDVVVAILEMRNQAKVTIHLSRALAYGYNVTTEVVGSEGSLQIGDLRSEDVVQIKQRTRGSTIQWHFRERFRDAFENEMTAFADLVRATDVQLPQLLKDSRYANENDGLMTTVVAEALVKSAATGVPQQVASD